MATAAELINHFVEWAATEGRQEMLLAIPKSDIYQGSTIPQDVERWLEHHLSNIKSSGIILSTLSIGLLMQYANECNSAPIPPQAAYDRLFGENPEPGLQENCF